jgi:DNA-binding beta-propeller fold protein YncE
MSGTVYGSGGYRFEVVPDWGRGPKGVEKFGLVSMVACDQRDRVYVFQREPEQVVLVFEADGTLVHRWGEGQFKHPHGIWIAPDQTVYCTDRDRHIVTQWTLDGQQLRVWGTPDQPGEQGAPFNEPSRAIVAPTGDLYVADGYGQHRAHRFAADGTLIRSWGEKGKGPGEFGWPVHSVAWHPAGKVLIVDRQNNRVQHFTPEGEFLDEWTDFDVPQDLYIDPDGTIYIVEGHPRVTLMTLDGEIITRWGEKGKEPGQFKASPHSCWVDRQGGLYVGEVTTHECFQKFVRV